MMVMTLVGVISAIESARKLSAGDSSPTTIAGIIRLLLAAVVAMGIAGGLGYAALRLLRGSGKLLSSPAHASESAKHSQDSHDKNQR
jgi:hypothetical protein